MFFRFVSPQGRVEHSGSIGSHSVDEDGNEIGHDEMEEQLSELQCDQSANNEICQIVSHRYKSTLGYSKGRLNLPLKREKEREGESLA